MQTTTKPSFTYESIEFNVNSGTTDYDLDAQQSTFLSKFNTNDIGYPTQVKIRTNNTITVKLNATDAHAITITSTDSPFDIRGNKIMNLFISNSSGNIAAVKLLFQDVEY